MEIKDTEIKYDLFHNIKLNTHLNGKITLTADEALDVAYAIVDSYGLDYEILDKLQDAYEEDKGEYVKEIEGKNEEDTYFDKVDRDYDDYIFENMED